MDLLDVLLIAISLMAVRKVQAKPTESSYAFPSISTNTTEDSTTSGPKTHRLRLMDGKSNCSGRVEFEENGVWGTVCDDNWDLNDAEVVCRQLGCGWAIHARNASYFQKGTGPIHLDEVKCSGNESYLWDCPSERNHDCGHKEDAGVVCSEHQEWRLSGGLDPCAGRVEVYYQGVWNTVCDSSWYQEAADLVCQFLGCSEKASSPKEPFNHTLRGRMYFDCSVDDDSLAECFWRYNNSNLCGQFKAVGVICNGSRGLRPKDTPEDKGVTPSSQLPTTHVAGPEIELKGASYQTLRVLCIALGLLLLLTVLTLITILWRRRKNGNLYHAISSGAGTAPVLVNHSVPVSTLGVNHDYRDASTILPKGEAPDVRPAAPIMEDSDSDYERYDFNSKPPVALSTFYNSLRHRAGGEDLPPGNFPMPAMHEENESTQPATVYYPQEAPTAEDSTSTSSGDEDWYENIHKHEQPEQQGTHPGNKPFFGGSTTSSRPVMNCEAGNGSSDSSDYDDMWTPSC
ncbi:T-cell differentiation antigen CD6 [Tiliqua scincoides]|uniref:T-cell differentiation antigen CD6 n=1 Tax=Tiliqua scincoides TaxID=71010 RepID=UPI0034620431